MKTGHDYSWFVLNRSIIKKEFTLSGSEQNPDFTGKVAAGVEARCAGPPAPVQAFMDKGEDFIVEKDLSDLVEAHERADGRRPRRRGKVA